MTPPASPHGSPRPRRLVVAALLALTCVLGLRDVTDDASVMLGGDMARYLMNGVFVRDLIADGGVWSVEDLRTYAERYYARYPALSLGHHPPLPYVTLVPFYAVFGISVLAARLDALFWFLLAVWGMQAVATRMFGRAAAIWATLLFLTNLIVLRAGQYVLSEMPMVAMVLLSVNALLGWCETRQRKYFVWFALAAGASLYAKQLAAFMLPVYIVIVVMHLGWRGLVTRRTLAVAGLVGALVVPIAVMSFGLAPANVALALGNATRLLSGGRDESVNAIIETILRTHLSLPALITIAASVVFLVLRRNRQLIVGLTWIVSVVGGSVVFAGAIEPARYAFGAMPAYFLLTAGMASEVATRAARAGVWIILSGAVLWQAWSTRDVRPSGAGGYEAAAEYVAAQHGEPAVLYDASVDTGYFVFFVRKHDPEGRLIVMRAEKLLAPPRVADDAGPDDVYAVLRTFGIQFVVVEDRLGGSLAHQSLQRAIRQGQFVERRRIPIVSRVQEVRRVNLIVYEFREAQQADPDAELDMALPLGKRSIRLRMRDLTAGAAR